MKCPEDAFRHAPVVTCMDIIEPGRIAHALANAGVNACVVNHEVLVAWEDVGMADHAVAALRRTRLDIDWGKVKKDWDNRTSYSTE